MKKRIVLLALLFHFASFSQNIDCTKFKIGKFYYPNLSNKVSVRNESTQESYNDGKLEMIWKLKWINECEYEIICQEVFVDIEIQPGDRIVTTITSTEEECFTYSFVFYNKEFPDGKLYTQGTMCILQE